MRGKAKPLPTARKIVEGCLKLRYFRPEGAEPAIIPAYWVPSRSKLIVVVGPNAGGKSFFRRILGTYVRHRLELPKDKIEIMPISVQGRADSGMGFARAFVYGDEAHQATGVNSIGTVLTGIRTCRGRTNSHMIIWDEPDLGLAEGASMGMGRTLAAFAKRCSKHTLAAVVITHSRALVRELLPVRPHYLHLGQETGVPVTLDAWTSEEPEYRSLEEVMEAGQKRSLAIQRILNDYKETAS